MGGRALGRVRAGGGWACARKASAGSQTHPRGTRREAGCAPGMAGHASGGRLLGARRTGGWALARRAPGSRARFEGWVCAGESDAPPPSGGGTLWEAECASGSRVRAGVCRGWLGMRPEGVCGEPDALGGIWVVRANWAGGEADCPPARPRAQRTRVPLGRPSRPPVALARPQRPRAQRARVPPGCPPACPGLAEPPARSTRAPACPARPRTAGLPTPAPAYRRAAHVLPPSRHPRLFAPAMQIRTVLHPSAALCLRRPAHRIALSNANQGKRRSSPGSGSPAGGIKGAKPSEFAEAAVISKDRASRRVLRAAADRCLAPAHLLATRVPRLPGGRPPPGGPLRRRAIFQRSRALGVAQARPFAYTDQV